MIAKFCLQCGHSLELRDVDGVKRLACTSCSFVHWGNYSVGVGGLVVKDNKVLLVRRAHDPGKGYWTNPGGFMEQLETIEETVIREVEEESGIKAKIKGIVGLRDQPRQIHNVYIAFSMQYISGTPQPDGVESDAAGFYSIEEMESMNVAPFTRWLVDIALQGKSEGLLKDEEPIISLKEKGIYRIL